ncbi:glycosyltransferase family 39 protein [Patescibacteria group bacterium]|nr:glycosyltransferase family 39 protein [Patescibacteria group bacterium]
MKIITKKIIFTITLIFILLIGAVLRLSGIKYGTPDLFHPDETRIILDTLSMIQRLSPISENINYPSLFKYILAITYGLAFFFGKIFGIYQDKFDFAIRFLVDPSRILILSRITTCVLGCVTIVIGYLWGLKIKKSHCVGLIAAIFLAVEWQLVLESQFVLHQTLSALASLIAFFGINLIFVNKNPKTYAFSGFLFGIALSSHHTTVLLVPTLLYTIIKTTRDEKNKKTVIKGWVLFALFSFLFGVVGNLNWIFKFKSSLDFLLQGSGAGKVAFSSTPYFSYTIPSITLWLVKELVTFDNLLGIILLIGIIKSLKNRSRSDISYLILIVTYLIFYHNWAFRWMHLFVSLIPIMCLKGAEALFLLLKKIKASGKLSLILVIAIIAPNIVQLSKFNNAKNFPETRQVAKSWIEDNIPPNTRIAVDWAAYAVPIKSDIPMILKNKIAEKYYQDMVPSNIKDAYLSTISDKPKYQIYQMIESLDNPHWPIIMPTDKIALASKEPVFMDLYSYFNFVPLAKLKENNVEYLVIESYTYGLFLESSDVDKEYLHNVYYKDQIAQFSNHDGKIATGTQHELLYYLAKGGRDYFKTIMNEQKEIKLIKEFRPTKNQIGPVVRIYQFQKKY